MNRASFCFNDRRLSVYLLFVDESGTHPGPHPFVLGGLAIHEDDASRLQNALDDVVVSVLGRIPSNLDEYEIHASELRNARKPRADSSKQPSLWANVPRAQRLELLKRAYEALAQFQPANPALPLVLFGIAVERNFRADWTPVERERWAYEVLLGKFDVMLKTLRNKRRLPNRGLVIHDRRVVAEHDIQNWVASWRVAAETIGQLRNLADVPLFGDSRATRLLQAADLVSYAVFRRYNRQSPSSAEFDTLWSAFHREDGVVHGAVHYTPSFGNGVCDCSPCEQRLLAEAAKRIRASPQPVRTSHPQ